MPPEPTRESTAPLSWRDVYRALGETETRIVAAINAAIAPLSATASDHEARLRAIEANGTPRVQNIERTLTALHARVDLIEKREDIVEGRDRGILATLSGAQKTVILVASIGGFTAAVLEILSRIP